MQNRRGRFKVSAQLIHDAPDVMMQIMGKMVVVRCEHHFDTDSFEYVALSPFFREVPQYEVTPEYTITVTQTSCSVTNLIEFHAK